MLRTITAVFIMLSAAQASADESGNPGCAKPVATLTSVQGRVEARENVHSPWRSVQLNQAFCGGDELRTGSLSRAQVHLQQSGPDTARDGTLLQLNEHAVLMLPTPAEPWWVRLLQGAAHILSRTPERMTIRTLYCNAKVEGTEFLVTATTQATQVAVYEGKVLVSNDLGNIDLVNGEAAIAEANKPPRREILLKPRDAVHWALYYPPIIDTRSARTGPYATHYQEVLAQYSQGQIAEAIKTLDALPADAKDADYHTLRAALYLTVGQVDYARQDLQVAGQRDPHNADVLALEAIIALVQNDKDKANTLAQAAIEAAPQSPTGHIAKSYVDQAQFHLATALATASKATHLDPNNGLAWARVAELELALGDRHAADQASDKARRLNPQLARTQTVGGYAALSRIDIDKAQIAFNAAIALDAADPLPRLGLGLAKIRNGALDEGRKDIEVAANLDPDNALVRSYLGKAYYEQKRADLAARELSNAKMLDTKDPTPWFYDGIRKQTENQPVEALRDIETSIELNDNRAIYRSRLALDDDVAARSVNLARVFDNLGFEQRARVEAWKSAATDHTNFSVHRFLADSYATLPRHSAARVSEVLQSQLLQPANVTPIQPQLAAADLSILQGAGPSSTSFYELNPLFQRNGPALQANAVLGNNATFGNDFVLSGMHGPFSGSVGQFHYGTDGWRKNGDLEQNIYNAFAQYVVSPDLTLQAELRRSEKDAGDIDITLNPPDLRVRQQINRDLARVSAHYRPGVRHDVLMTVAYADDETINRNTVANPFIVNSRGRVDGYSGELQHLFRGERFNTIAGLGHVRVRDQFSLQIQTPLIDLPAERTYDEATNGYLYAPIALGHHATLTLGASYDILHSSNFEREQLSPKLGLVWDITPATTLRIAAFRTLKRFFTNEQTLEPTQLAGFNQFFDDLNGSASTRYGIGLDQRLSQTLFGGLEMSWRDIATPQDVNREPVREGQREQFHRAYLNWAPTNNIALALQYQFEEYRRDTIEGRDARGLAQLRTHYLPLTMNYYHPSGIFARVGTTYVNQEAVLPDARTQDGDQFWVVDAAVGYRLPKRYGIVSLEAKNLFDESFRYQNAFDENEKQLSRFQPARAVFARINLWFY